MPDLKTLETAVEKLRVGLETTWDAGSGCWRGRLADSAVSTAVAALAMSLLPQDRRYLEDAVEWLCENTNADGGWGDTVQSPANLSAVLLARAAIINSGLQNSATRRALADSQKWLQQKLPTFDTSGIVAAILDFYGRDLTFSAPILTVSMLSGALGEDAAVWRQIPALPFEASLLPARFFSLLRLPVVSYAIPALIAVGIAHTRHLPPANPLLRRLRQHSIRPALRKLQKLVPEGGGFLEAAPLTAFVAFCLGRSGFIGHEVVTRGLEFLRRTVRSNGSWPIDTDLSTWVTSLAVKGLSRGRGLSPALRKRLSRYYSDCQTKKINVFTGAAPGGWSWTRLSGGVPDADDTAGALTALAFLRDANADAEVLAGLRWLLNLINSDGGVPTFCRGWGYLPFDRSCPDISAHALQAFALWLGRTDKAMQSRLEVAISGILKYLERSRDGDGVWSPLWFGDQDAPEQKNRVYGTAVVLEALSHLPESRVQHLCRPATAWLLRARNSDGGFGGEPQTPAKIETTARALSSLVAVQATPAELAPTLTYLLQAVAGDPHRLPSAPVGMYFASLWYDEQLYPQVFALDALAACLETNVCLESAGGKNA